MSTSDPHRYWTKRHSTHFPHRPPPRPWQRRGPRPAAVGQGGPGKAALTQPVGYEWENLGGRSRLRLARRPGSAPFAGPRQGCRTGGVARFVGRRPEKGPENGVQGVFPGRAGMRQGGFSHQAGLFGAFLSDTGPLLKAGDASLEDAQNLLDAVVLALVLRP